MSWLHGEAISKKFFSFFHFSALLKYHWPIQASSLKSHSPAGRIYSPLVTRRVLMKRLSLLPGGSAWSRGLLPPGGCLPGPGGGSPCQGVVLPAGGCLPAWSQGGCLPGLGGSPCPGGVSAWSGGFSLPGVSLPGWLPGDPLPPC